MAGMGLVVPWYFTYEPVIEEVQEQWNLFLLLLPVLLVFALIVISTFSSSDSAGGVLNSLLPASDPGSIHRVGGSPVGLALLLLLILTMIWYHSDILDSWNPLVRS
ncbi:hypothetical protein KP509_19G076500 [Ceratopteris richardii]|nr:hypothetical protein KP509_19G076500 [Ceratopteris richardii]